MSHEEALAIGVVLWRAHERARALARQLELEADQPVVGELYAAAKDLQRRIAAAIIDVATTAVVRGGRTPVPAILDPLEGCESIVPEAGR